MRCGCRAQCEILPAISTRLRCTRTLPIRSMALSLGTPVGERCSTSIFCSDRDSEIGTEARNPFFRVFQLFVTSNGECVHNPCAWRRLSAVVRSGSSAKNGAPWVRISQELACLGFLPRANLVGQSGILQVLALKHSAAGRSCEV